MRGKPLPMDSVFRQSMAANIENVVKKAEALGCKQERENVRHNNSLSQQELTSVLGYATWRRPNQRRPPDCYQPNLNLYLSSCARKDGRIVSTLVLVFIFVVV